MKWNQVSKEINERQFLEGYLWSNKLQNVVGEEKKKQVLDTEDVKLGN